MAIKKYLICDNNCKFEGLDKEETLSAIQQAIENGGVKDVNPTEPFITQIKDINTGAAVKLWVGTEAQFNDIEVKAENTLYIYSTDFEANVGIMLAELQADIKTLQDIVEKIINGSQKVKKAEQADKATTATNATKVNNLEIKKDANGVLKIGDIIIPQKKLLFAEKKKVTSGSAKIDIYEDTLSLQGRTLEICMNGRIYKIKADLEASDINEDYCYEVISPLHLNHRVINENVIYDYSQITFIVSSEEPKKLKCIYSCYENSLLSTSAYTFIDKIYEIIE